GQFINGTLSDIFGRKPLLIISLALFTLASYAATLVNNIYFLLLIRAIQGIASAGPSVIAKALLTDTMSGAELKRASIYMVTIWGLSPIIAPAIGGYLQHYYGWHANFYFFAIYSLSMFIVVAALLKETLTNPAELKLKSIAEKYKTILSDTRFLANLTCMALAYSIIMIFNIFVPFLVQDVLGYSAIKYGHIAMFIGLAFLIGSLSNRWLMTKFKTADVNRVGVILLVLVAVITMISAYLTKMDLVTLSVPAFFMVLIVGLLQTNFMTHNLSLFPHMGGTASAAMGMILILISGFITTIGSFIHHANGQVVVNWIYAAIIGVYAFTYWVFLDKHQQNEEIN
ncbi:MAG: MFS transporter, partial [Coxiellaceae bacterium]|nr:MFS transporter [Coxiellaceae bacterium]